MKRRPSVQRAFDEIRFGPSRILNLRDGLPTADDARAHAEGWLRARQVERAGEVLIITGRGAGSVDGVAVLRGVVQRLLFTLRRKGVVAKFREHTAGSFIVELSPLIELFEAPARARDARQEQAERETVPTLAGLSPELALSLATLARRALEALGVQDPTAEMVAAEGRRQFSLLVQGLRGDERSEAVLATAAVRALREYDDASDA